MALSDGRYMRNEGRRTGYELSHPKVADFLPQVAAKLASKAKVPQVVAQLEEGGIWVIDWKLIC